MFLREEPVAARFQPGDCRLPSDWFCQQTLYTLGALIYLVERALKKTTLFLLSVLAIIIALMAVFPEDTTRIMFALERERGGVEVKTVVVDGETWPYLEGGSPDAPVLLLLHGFGGDKDNWTRFARTPVRDFRLIAPDLPGFGDTARYTDWDYSITSQRDRLRAFVTALDLAPVHIGGNSMGGHLAAVYTHAYPNDVQSLFLLNNGGIDAPEKSELVLAVGRGENPLVVDSAEDFDRLIAFSSHKPPLVPWPAKGVLAQQAADNAAFNRFIFASLIDERRVPLEPLLGDIRHPVLIVWGEFDRVLDVSSIDVMKPLLPQARIVVMRDTGHIPMLERPAETAAHYLEFLAGLESSD